jgi:hypothetical protein
VKPMLNPSEIRVKDPDIVNASKPEQLAILQFMLKAREMSPATKLRFVQKQEDEFGTLLTLSLDIPDLSEAENFRLYELAQEFYQEGKLDLTVTVGRHLNHDKQVLRLKSFVKKDDLIDNFKEPAPTFMGRFHIAPGQVSALLILAVVAIMFVMVLSMNVFLRESFPALYPGVVTRRGPNAFIKTARTSLDQTIWDISRELGTRTLDHQGDEWKNLERQRELLEKARRDLQ